MATQNTVPDASSSFEDKIAYLRANNISEDTIAQHFSQSDDPNAQAWSKQYKMAQFENQARKQIDANPVTPALQTSASNAPAPVGNGLVTAATHVADKLGNWYDKLSTPEQIAVPVGAYLGNKAINLGFNTLKDKIAAQIAAQTQIDKYAKIQEIKNAANQASQATQAASEISPETPAPVQNNPAPVPETAPAPEVKPTLAELVAAKPSKANPSTVDGGNAPSAEAITPSASAPSTPAEVVTDPTSTPVEKAVTLTQEAPKVAGAAVPKTKNVLAFPDVPPPVIPPGTPVNSRRTPAQMEVFNQENPLNKGYTQVASAAGITPKTPPEEAHNFMNRVTDEVFGGKPPASQGGAAPQAKQVTNFIETNKDEFPNIYNRLKEIQARYPTQSGIAHLQMLSGIGLNLLGGLGLYHDYKEGQQTGDWSNLGLNSIGQVLGNVLPKTAGMGANLMLHHEEAGRNSALYGPGTPYKNYAEFQQASKIGAGRGMQGVPPPNR